MTLTIGACRDEPPPRTLTYHGMSDASAAAAVDNKHMLVADDETSSLRLYRLDGDLPVKTLDLSDWLDTEAEHGEADIEGAARIGRRVY
ncbi:MAG: hypothetical protein ACOC7R_02175 [Planctomycetota bacterium]